jgi:alkylated DNA repair protein (DNA oxidative demethylase)
MGSLKSSTRRGGATSSLGGVPVVLPPVDESTVDEAGGPVAGQMTFGLGFETAEPEPMRSRNEPLGGVVHVPDWLDAHAQQDLAGQFRSWARPPAGLRHPRMPTGQVMTVQSVCLGWHWSPYAYSRTADDTDGAPVKALPTTLRALARAAVAEAYGADSPEAIDFEPDAVIVNRYPHSAKLGLHQDGEEPSDAPVVTISLGDTCTFRMAGVDRRTGPFTDVAMRSGDLLVFGRQHRRIFHGVPKVFPHTGPTDLGLPGGRVSITVRQTGFT